MNIFICGDEYTRWEVTATWKLGSPSKRGNTPEWDHQMHALIILLTYLSFHKYSNQTIETTWWQNWSGRF